MNALRFHGQRDIRVDTIPIPTPGPGQVKCAPQFCGICGTDLHEYLLGSMVIPAKGHPHPVTGEEPPVVIGHEFSAIVEEVGEGVENIKPGDRVCIEGTLRDNTCDSCQRGYYQCCKNSVLMGLSGGGGGLAQHVVVPAYSLKVLPENVSLKIGALVEPLSVGWHAVRISPFKAEHSVLVLGGGPIGLALIQILLSKGCKKIIVSEVSSKRSAMARSFGAHHTVNPATSDAMQEIMGLTNGLGVDVAFDAAGVQVAADLAFKVLKTGATMMNVAVWEKPAIVNMTELLLGEKHYMTSMAYSQGDFEDVIEAISSGMFQTHHLSKSRSWNAKFCLQAH